MSDVIFPTEIPNGTPVSDDRIMYSDTSEGEATKDCALSELPISTAVQNAINEKVDNETGKSLSTNDYSDIDKEKVSTAVQNIYAGANTTVSRSGNDIFIGNIAGGGGGNGNAGAYKYYSIGATESQTVFTIFEYVLGNNLIVFLNGQKMQVTGDYNETSTTSITFTYGLKVGDIIEFYYPNKGINWKGAYNNSYSYIVDDGVSYEGSSYICIQDSKGNIPINTSYFELFASKGGQGEPGTDGTDGVGILSVTLISTVGKVKTYRITYTDSTTFDFIITDGSDGIGNMLKSENLSGLTNNADARINIDVYSKAEVNNLAGDYALKTGETFTGVITATNLSNTNTGDQTITIGSVTATGGQTVVTVGNYVLGNNKLRVLLNGIEQSKTEDYTETSTTSITFTFGLTAGDVVKFSILS